jgi:hypothetical protein
VALAGERESHDYSNGMVFGDEGQEPRHGKAAAGTAGEGLELRRKQLGLIRKGETDPDRAPVHAQHPARPWDH